MHHSAPEAEVTSLASRYTPCHILVRSGIPNVIWFEDALVFYGSDTAVFDLYLLVPDACKAAEVLLAAGYTETGLKTLFPNDERSCRGGVRLEGPGGSSGDGTVLLNASIWNYDLQHKIDGSLAPLPPLNEFVAGIMTYWLSMSEKEYSEKFLWAISLVNLINYAYNLQGPNAGLVRSNEFAQQLSPELRELHYDLVGNYPQKSGVSCYRKHEYHVLRWKEIQEGKFTPRPYPSSNFPISLAEYPQLTGLDTCGSTPKRKGRSSVC